MKKRNNLMIVWLLLVSCAPSSKLAKKCADRFPVKTETVFIPGESRYDTTYITGDTMVLSDTVRIECDSAKQVITKYVYRTAKCPDSRVITEYTTDTVFIKEENTAKTSLLQSQVDILIRHNKGLWKSVLWLAAISISLTAWTFRNTLLSIIKKVLS